MSVHTSLLSEIDALRDQIKGKYPDLTVFASGNKIVVRGSFPILFEGEELDRFLIEVVVPPEFPGDIPTLREIDGRVPHTDERHTNQSGESCPLVPEEWLLLPEKERTVLRFLEWPVRNFLLFQALADRGEEWPWGERLHGRAGLIQAYGEMLGMDSEQAIVTFLAYLSGKKIRPHWACPCGSGKRIQDCHSRRVYSARTRISRSIAQSALARLKMHAK